MVGNVYIAVPSSNGMYREKGDLLYRVNTDMFRCIPSKLARWDVKL